VSLHVLYIFRIHDFELFKLFVHDGFAWRGLRSLQRITWLFVIFQDTVCRVKSWGYVCSFRITDTEYTHDL